MKSHTIRLVAVVATVVSSGCGSSVLVRRDDAVFAGAERRLATTATFIEGQGVPPEERLLALQAEGFYRYRFEPPARGFSTSAAKAAAAVIEIPAIQSVAGALDIFDLRLRSYDAAVQLWETFLERYPQSRLRPLVLYRLGWAYPSSEAAGFPRHAGTEAFDALIKEFPGSPFSPLAAEAKQLHWKSKDSATALSVVPGLGQMYVGRYARGATRLLVGLAAVTMIVAPTIIAYERRSDLSWSRDWPLLTVGVGGLVVLSLDYTLAYDDAVRRVVEWNEHVESAFEDAHPQAP